MRKSITNAPFRVTEIVVATETERSLEVNESDKACEIFHHGVGPSVTLLYHIFETGWAEQREAPPERGRLL